MFLVVLHRVHTVKRERREKRESHDRFPHPGYPGSDLVAQEMPAQSWFGALGIFEFNDLHSLDGLFPDAEKSCGHLGDDMVVIRFELIRIPSFPGAAKSSSAEAALIRLSMVVMLTDP